MAFTRLPVLAALGALLSLAAAGPSFADAAKGKALFQMQCSLCHSAGADGGGMQGPELAGVVGRKAGTAEFPYTDAIKNSGLTWTPDQLDAFLTDPQKKVPGTAMPISVPDAKDRKDLIDYLSGVK